METAIGFIEFSSIAKGIEALDAMLKMAQVRVLHTQAIPRGKYVVLIVGHLGEVQQSMQAGLELGQPTVLDSFIIPNVHEQVLPAFKARIKVPQLEAVGLIETKDAARAIFAADAAAKKAQVTLIEVFPGRGAGGKGYVTFTGEVGAVRSALAAGVQSVQPPEALLQAIVIPYAHKDLLNVLTQ